MFVGPRSDPDKYRLIELQSPGAEGELWRAENVAYGMPIAVKVIHAAHGGQLDEWRDRWQRQVDLLKTLSHPGVVRVEEVFDGAKPHEKGSAGDGLSLYLAMSYVYGPSLPEWVARNPDRDALDSIKLIAALSATMDHLHHANTDAILHRDVKPQNVIVGPSGPVLVDFGFARLEEPNVKMTMIGTAGYVAPEVAAGYGFSTASDRFALGATAYFILTGSDPSHADPQRMKDRLNSVRGLEGRTGLQDAILQMMSADPASRPASAINWAANLAAASVIGGNTTFGTIQMPNATSVSTEPAAVESPATAQHASNRKSRGKASYALMSVAALALIGLVGMLFTRTETAQAMVTFAPIVIGDQTTATRTWITDADTLSAEVIITNAGQEPFSGDYVEVIPKSLAADVSAITFSPSPDEIVVRDPVVRYRIENLASGQSVQLSYKIALSGASQGELDRLAADQAVANEEYFAAVGGAPEQLAVASIDLPVTDVALVVGETFTVAASASLEDGSAVDRQILDTLQWGSSDLAVVQVSEGGLLEAVGEGSATVSLQLGDAAASLEVIVSADVALLEPTETTDAAASSTTTSAATVTTKPPATITTKPPVTTSTTKPRVTTTTTKPRVTTTTIKPPVTTTTTKVTTTTSSTTTTSTTTTTIALQPPAAPSPPSATSLENAKSTVAWSAPASAKAILEYKLKISTGEERSVGTSTSYVWSGLANGSSYTFTVAARNADGWGPFSASSSAAKPATVPSKQSAPGVTAGNARVTISWSAPATGGSAITKYQVQADTGANGTADGTKDDSASPLAWTGLSNGTNYKFRVRACNAVGCGTYSSWSATVKPVAPKVVSLSKGASAAGQPGCSSSACKYLAVSASGFSASTSYSVSCQYNSIEFYSYSRTTSSSGSISSHQVCYYGFPGDKVSAVIGGVRSNVITW